MDFLTIQKPIEWTCRIDNIYIVLEERKKERERGHNNPKDNRTEKKPRY